MRLDLYDLGIRPVFTSKGKGLTWPGPLYKRIGWKIGAAFIRIGIAMGGEKVSWHRKRCA